MDLSNVGVYLPGAPSALCPSTGSSYYSVASVFCLVDLATFAEKVGDYDRMAKCMGHVVESKKGTLTAEERNLFSVAYKNVVGRTRLSLREIADIKSSIPSETKVRRKEKLNLLQAYREELEKKLLDDCTTVDGLVDNILESIKQTEDIAFYLKMKADYFRYQVDVTTGSKEDVVKKAEKYYQEATKSAAELLCTHPTRLGLALNMAVFYYDTLNDSKKACEIAKKAFDDAMSKLDTLDDRHYKDTTLIMQLLRDNLTIWTSNNNNENENEQADFHSGV